MRDENKTKKQLIKELNELRLLVSEPRKTEESRQDEEQSAAISEKQLTHDRFFFSENQEIVEYLKKSRLFSHLPDQLLNQLNPLSEVVDYSKGEEILTEGQPNSKIYFLIDGRVGIYSGGEFILELQRKGDIFGEMSCISEKPCSASVRAETPIRVFSVQARDVGKYTDIDTDTLQHTIYRVFSMILTEKLSVTTYKAQQYERTHRNLLNEIANHKKAQDELVKYRDTLEQMVEERTRELTKINQQLTQEISDRKKTEEILQESEERYHELFESESDAILVFDEQTLRIENVNQAALDLFGYTKEEFLNLTEKDILTEKEYLTIKYNVLSDDLQNMKAPLRYMKTKHGAIFPAEVSLGSYVSKGYAKIIESVRDITDRLQAEEKRLKLEEQLRQSQKMEAIGTLAGGIAHDFNNILGTMLGYTELLLRKQPERSVEREYLQEVFDSGERAADLITQLLTFSRVEEHDLTPLQPSVLIFEALKLMRATLPANIEIRQDMGGSKSLIMANSTQMHQIIINLCTNANYAMKERGGILEVRLDEVKYEEDQHIMPELQRGVRYLKISISDTGCGINAEIRDRIFEPFFTTKEVGEGSGLGLSVVHGIVKNHDGEITFEDNHPTGTIFHVYIPVADVRPEKTIEKTFLEGKGQEHILVVEDEKSLATYYEISLRELGYQVTLANNGWEALNAFNAQPDEFDLVFTDQAMPVMTGDQLSQELLRIKPDLPIILATGYSSVISEKQLKDMGVNQFLMKPVKINMLTKLIREAFA